MFFHVVVLKFFWVFHPLASNLDIFIRCSYTVHAYCLKHNPYIWVSLINKCVPMSWIKRTFYFGSFSSIFFIIPSKLKLFFKNIYCILIELAFQAIKTALGLGMETEGFPSGSDGKESAYNTGDPGSIPGSGRSPGEGNG